MPKYYCHECSIRDGFLGNEYTSSLLGSTYQLEKYIKHTIPNPGFSYASIFDSPSTEAYRFYILEASCAGSVEIDDYGRRNIIWFSTGRVGARYIKGRFEIPTDAVKVVLSSDPERIHAFPESSTCFTTERCVSCGKPIIA